jgi:hypothetical protein
LENGPGIRNGMDFYSYHSRMCLELGVEDALGITTRRGMKETLRQARVEGKILSKKVREHT